MFKDNLICVTVQPLLLKIKAKSTRVNPRPVSPEHISVIFKVNVTLDYPLKGVLYMLLK